MRLDRIALCPGSAVINRVTSAGSELVSVRAAHKWDEFGDALRRWSQAAITVEDGPELVAPADNAIQVCRPEMLERAMGSRPEQMRELTSRTVVVDMVRTYALDYAERLGVAGVVDTHQYYQWADTKGGRAPSTLYGRIDVARALGATWSSIRTPPTAHYALLSHPDFPEFPALLARYLEKYVTLV